MSKALYFGCTAFRDNGKEKPEFLLNTKKKVDRNSIRKIINENPEQVLTIPAEDGGRPKGKEEKGEEK